jgi:superfamily I DNA and RNA helicase
MTLWWARKDQLDRHQVALIESLALRRSHLVLGPPGSGKTNVLLRRAQFVRTQGMPNILVLTFTRPLTEFLKTGCVNAQGREIFPRSCVSTLESWIRDLYRKHDAPLPAEVQDLAAWKRSLATGAMSFADQARLPQYDALFIDEVQDLMAEEVQLLAEWTPVLFCVGDDRQKIYNNASGIEELRRYKPELSEHTLPFHYRVAPEICQMADRIMKAQGGSDLSSTQHYTGPTPGRVEANGPLIRQEQMSRAASKLRDQIRVYADFIKDGDRLGIVVPRTRDREAVFNYLQEDGALIGKSQIIRARSSGDRSHSTEFDGSIPICILTVAGCKGLEFRALHWLFCDDLNWHHNTEHYYTVVTRAKTSLDLYYETTLPQDLARSLPPKDQELW